MDKKVLDHYLEFSVYTYPGRYEEDFKNLPNNIRELGLLVRKNIIHRSTLAKGNTGTNKNLQFGDMTKIPWWRQPEDDILVTVPAMLAELYRRDGRGLVSDRKPEDKLVLTCRFVSVLIASILKSKGTPCRVRAGHSPYFDMCALDKVSTDHWINQYWDEKENKWITIDIDGSLSLNEKIDPYDIPDGKFDFPAKNWLDIRSRKDDPTRFHHATPADGIIVVVWALFYDFHSLMNDEIIYTYKPRCGYGNPDIFEKLSEKDLKRIDDLAKLMLDPDENFDKLLKIWETEKDFRLLTGGLL